MKTYTTLWLLVPIFFLDACTVFSKDKEATMYDDSPLIDSVIIQINHSGQGTFVINKDSIAYFDKYFCTISVADLKTLSFGKPRLGIKDSVLSQLSFSNALCKNDRYYVLSNYKICELNTSASGINNFSAFTFPSTQTGKMLENEPSAKNPAVYEPDYINPHFVIINDSIGLINITAEHPFFNAYNSYSFYNTGYSVAEVNLKKNRVYTIFGKRKGIYRQKHFIPYFHSALLGYDDINHYILIGYEADTMIYRLNKAFQTVSSFGRKSKYFNDNYPVHSTIASAFDTNVMNTEREKYGRNLNILLSDGSQYLLRSYQTGEINGHPSRNRIQIYKEDKYWKDILLPLKAVTIGVKDDILFAAKLNSEKESEAIIYRITLN